MGFPQRWVGVSVLVAAAAGCYADPPEPRFFRDRSVRTSPPQQAAKPAEQENTEQAPPPPPRPMRPRTPTSPDPLNGEFPLGKAVEGLGGKGKLHASIETGLGTLDCTLYDDKAPYTVANFVGLARGLRPFWDANAGEWVKRPLYDGTTFHRVIPDFMIQGGDHLGNGTGEVGYNLKDEIWPGTSHDRAGLLCMANRGPNTNGGQFFITDAAAPHLTAMRTYTVFGECTPVDVIHKIARAPKMGERPEPPVPIQKVTITRR